MQEIMQHYQSRFSFRPGAHFRYVPESQRVEFPRGLTDSPEARRQLLHEISHGLLGHRLGVGLDHPTMEHDADCLSALLAPAFEIYLV